MSARSLGFVTLLAAALLIAVAYSTHREAMRSFTEDGISFRHPAGWHVVGFSTTNQPRRLVVTSYPVPADAVEGDCGGHEAIERLPAEGALVLLIDYGKRASFPPRPDDVAMHSGEFAEYECFGASTMFRFNVGGRDLQAHVAVGSRADRETLDRALAILSGLTVGEQPTAVGGEIDFAPATHREGDRVVLPVTFTDGTSAALVYPPELDVAGLGVFPYGSGTLRGKSPVPGRSDFVARDFWIRHGDLDDILALRDGGTPPTPLAEYEGVDGQTVGLWDLRSDDAAHKLGFQFGRWAVLVYDYVAAGAMTDAERASWAASFAGHETADGFLVLEATGPLRLAAAGEHAGPQLTFSASEPQRELTLFPGECRPHRDQNRLVDGKRVQWSGGFADWCLSDTMRIHAGGSREFIDALIRDLAVRNVVLAG